MDTSPRPIRLLVVDDHPDTLLMMQKLLAKAGFQVMTATSVESAVSLARESQFDVVVSDIGLPDGSGYELLKKLRTFGTFKAIAMSGYGLDEDIKKSQDAGFDQHVVKPVKVSHLEEVIRRMLSA